MRSFCIVPARGGSKRFPGKNIAKLGEKPLIHHTLEVVSPLFDKVIFSTDSIEILEVAQQLELDNVEYSIRPHQLATDTSKVIDTVVHYFKQHRKFFDEVWLALPTCPLRLKEDVEKAQARLLNTPEADGILSITDCEFPPVLSLQADENMFIEDWHESQPWQKGNSRSQSHKPVFRPNGALYGMKCTHFEQAKNFYKGKILGHYMPRERSIDVDTELDFKVAEVLLNDRLEKKNNS